MPLCQGNVGAVAATVLGTRPFAVTEIRTLVSDDCTTLNLCAARGLDREPIDVLPPIVGFPREQDHWLLDCPILDECGGSLSSVASLTRRLEGISIRKIVIPILPQELFVNASLTAVGTHASQRHSISDLREVEMVPMPLHISGS
jgi:hypothetical protein